MSNTYTPKELVRNIFKELEGENRATKIAANSLTYLAGDLYTETERFIFELLQNADDLPNENHRVSVKFVFLNNYFLILHDGKPFDAKNVDAICDIAESTKSKNIDQTGYKGIGFKSVFSDSECVYINSGEFSFKFDRNSDKHQNRDRNPWQIKPIWVERNEYPQEIRSYSDFFESPVATALEITNAQIIGNYKEKIQKLFAEPRLILFLRHICLIEVHGLNNLCLDIKLSKSKHGDVHTIQYTTSSDRQTRETRWIIKNFEFSVSQKLRNAMENDKKVPDKLKYVQKSKLTFAAQIINNKIHPVRDSVLFTYLPTNVQEYGFPFLVNADFLTTANRQSIHVDNTWNAFLFEKIGYYIFEWMAHLAQKTEYKNFIIAILPRKFKKSSTELQEKFNRGFDQAVDQVPFLPAEKVCHLLKVDEAAIDKTRISELIPERLIFDHFETSGHFVSYSLENIQNLEDLEKIGIFNTECLSSLIAKHKYLRDSIQSFPEYCLSIVKHIYREKLNAEFFVNVPFLLDEQGNLRSPQSLYFQVGDQEKQELIFTSINFLNPLLNDEFCKQQNLKTWAKQSLKIKTFSGLDFLRDRIRKRQFEPDIEPRSLKTLVAYVRFIFKHHKKLSQLELSQLWELRLIFEKLDGKFFIDNAKNCHLSDFYNPQGTKFKPVAEMVRVTGFKFLSERYCGDYSQVYEWKNFFTAIGVEALNTVLILKKIIIPTITNNEITERNIIPITQFVFEISKSQSLSDIDLKCLPLKTNSGLKPAYRCQIVEAQFNTICEHSKKFAIPLQNVVDMGAYESLGDIDDFRQFLITVLKVKVTTSIDFIRQKIDRISKEPSLVTVDNTISVVREIFSYRDRLTDEELQNLKVLNLLLKDGKSVARAEFCYLSYAYKPILNMEQIYASTEFSYFVSSQYCDHKNYKEWKNFFLRINVMEEFSFVNTEYSLKEFESIKIGCNAYKEYLREIADKKYTHLQNYFAIKHSYYLSTPNFSAHILNYINSKWKELNLEFKNFKAFLIDKDSGTKQEVETDFEFFFKHTPSIPCWDGNCHAPLNGIYSSNLKILLEDCVPVSSLQLKSDFEKFLGIKQELDVTHCLQVLDDIRDKFSRDPIRQKQRLQELLTEHLGKKVTKYSKEIDKNKIKNWVERGGQLLSYSDKFNDVRDLFYLDPELGLSTKNNPHLLQIPRLISNEKKTEFIAENVVSLFDIKILSRQKVEIQLIGKKEGNELKKVISEKAICIGIFIKGSRSIEVEQHIQLQLQATKFYNPEKILISFDVIDYQESIPNYHDRNTSSLYYTRQWNNIRNAKIGDLILEVLQLDRISSQDLLRLLDDSWEDVKKYLLEKGCDISEILDRKLLNIEESIPREEETIVSGSTTSPDGTGNLDYGPWGEEQARNFYEKRRYTVQKIDSFSQAGYDFKCSLEPNGYHKLLIEVKTISSINPIVRLKESQWKTMKTPPGKFIDPKTLILKTLKYKLLIVAHTGYSVDQIIEIENPWQVLEQFISKLDSQEKTHEKYKEKVEVIVGLQQNKSGYYNEILVNWHRLVNKNNDDRIKIYSGGNLNLEL